MGSGSSFLRKPDDDCLGSDMDGTSRGVIKRIPIEMKPRGRLMGLKSVGSLGKKQPKTGGSLQSALSFDVENPEVEKIRKDLEMFRLNKESEILNLQKRDQKLEMENKRLRSELLALQKTCVKLRAERDAASDAEHQAFARAAAFESDRDKVQRQFKIFRETKETELQNLLRGKSLDNHQVTRNFFSNNTDDSENVSHTGVDSVLGDISNSKDWWVTSEIDSINSALCFPQANSFYGTDFSHASLELDSPFSNIGTDVQLTLSAAKSVASMDYLPSCMIRVYISAPRDTSQEIELLFKDYVPRLEQMCLCDGRFLVVVHLQSDEGSSQNKNLLLSSRLMQIHMSSVFVAFLGEHTNEYSVHEFHEGHLSSPGYRPAVFCFRDPAYKGCKPSQGEAKDLKAMVRESFGASISDGYACPADGVEYAYSEIKKFLSLELKLDSLDDDETGSVAAVDSTRVAGCHLWDPYLEHEQDEILAQSLKMSCNVNLEKYLDKLNSHVAGAGPLPPLLVLGPAGSGKSSLLAKWISMQHKRNFVLYHFVGRKSSMSADPLVMIRRLTNQLAQRISSLVELSNDALHLTNEFSQLLERVSSHCPGGITVVLDSIDKFSEGELHLQWLLDPLPVDLRVIVSANEKCCSHSWLSWPSVRLDMMDNKDVRELLTGQMSVLDVDISHDNQIKILRHCYAESTSVPLYVTAVTGSLALQGKLCNQSIDEHLDRLLSTTDCIGLYRVILSDICQIVETPDTRGLVRKILRYIYLSHNGLTEAELSDLIPSLDWMTWIVISYALISLQILTFRSGVATFAHSVVEIAVKDKFLSGKSSMKTQSQLKSDITEYFLNKLKSGVVSHRVVDELLPLVYESHDKNLLYMCLVDLNIFQYLYLRGRCHELLKYWGALSKDLLMVAQEYTAAIRLQEQDVKSSEGEEKQIGLAEVCLRVGCFLKDMDQHTEALPLMQLSLDLCEMSLDPDHPLVARSLHHLAGLHTQLGKFLTAEALFKQALEIYETCLGRDHELVFRELCALSALYVKQDKHDLGDSLKKRMLSIKKKTKTQTMWSKKDMLRCRRILQLQEMNRLPNNPNQARVLNQLGVLCYLQNNTELAESYFKQSLSIREALDGEEHPSVSQTLNNLASLLSDRQLFGQAEELYQRALQIRLKHYGSDHSSVAHVLRQLAFLSQKQSKWQEAETYYKQFTDIMERILGKRHPMVAVAAVNMAVLYSQQSRHDKAEPYFIEALNIFREALGENHCSVCETLRNLALMKYEQGDFDTAARYYKRVMEIKEAGLKSRRSSATCKSVR